MLPTIGRIVLYRLSAEDAKKINRRRTTGPSIVSRLDEDRWPAGAQAHIGNEAREGDVLPMIIVRVWDPSTGVVNGQVLLDGNDTFWTNSVRQGTQPGEWIWPLRV